MQPEIVSLGRDYPGKIDDFSQARNYFLERYEWVFFWEQDEEASQMLLKHIRGLKPTAPYYWVRRINLLRGRYVPTWNPEYSPQLVSNKCRFYGKVHEHITPRHPYGIIDYPIIHDQPNTNASYQNKWYQNHPLYSSGWMAVKKIMEVARGR